MTHSIIIGKGLENLSFGLQKTAARFVLGDPDEIERFAIGPDEEDNTEAWHYDEIEVSLSFDEDEDWTLSAITSSHPDLTLDNVELIGITKEELLSALENFDFGIPEEETIEGDDDEDPLYVLSFPDANLTFWMDEEVVTEVQWGPLTDEDGEYIWPEAN